MKLEVGMYVRTKWGYICKLLNINDFREPTMKYGVEANYLRDVMFIGDEDIKKASHNIIDLIEKGDYVNGYKVTKVNKDRFFTNEQDYYAGGWGNKIYGKDFKTDIKTIVTKEQFKLMEYVV